MVQLSHLYMTTGKTIDLTLWKFVSKVMFLLFIMLSRFVIAFLPKSKCLLISWLHSLSAVILEPKKMKSVIRQEKKLDHMTLHLFTFPKKYLSGPCFELGSVLDSRDSEMRNTQFLFANPDTGAMEQIRR